MTQNNNDHTASQASSPTEREFRKKDKRTLRAILLILFMFSLSGILIAVGKYGFGIEEADVNAWFSALQDSRWSLLLIIATFTVGAFIGVPQWAMMGATVLAFGPLLGSFYAWFATMISAGFDFWIGRKIGAERFERFGGPIVMRVTKLVRKNGILASFMVRFVPLGPFVIVNMAAGVSGMSFLNFCIGTCLGIVPKIAIVGLLALGFVSRDESQGLTLMFVGLAVALVATVIVIQKRFQTYMDQDTSAQ